MSLPPPPLRQPLFWMVETPRNKVDSRPSLLLRLAWRSALGDITKGRISRAQGSQQSVSLVMFSCWTTPWLFFFFYCILAAPGLGCGTWDLLVAACGLLSCCMHAGSSSPNRDKTPGPVHWDHGVLPTGPPGKSPNPLAFNTPASQSAASQHVFQLKFVEKKILFMPLNPIA